MLTISKINECLSQISNEQSEYHLQGILLNLFSDIHPYESALFANYQNGTTRVLRWDGANPSLLRRAFNKLNKDKTFNDDMAKTVHVIFNKRHYYFIPIRKQNELLAVIGIETLSAPGDAAAAAYELLASQASINIEKNRLEEWSRMTDYIIYILEPIFASQSTPELVKKIRKGSLTLLGADRAEIYCNGIEGLSEIVDGKVKDEAKEDFVSIEHYLAKVCFEQNAVWSGTVGQFFDDFPQARELVEVPSNLRSILGVPIRDRNGEAIGGIAASYFFTDLAFENVDKEMFLIYAEKLYRAITNKLALFNLEMANDQLKQLDEIKEKTMYEVTHDLKTPIGAIKGFSELLLQTEQDKDAQKLFIEHIFNASNSLLTMVQDLLDLAKLKSTGEFSLKDFEDSDINELVKDVCTTASGISKIHQIDLDLAEDLPKVKLDQKSIHRVVSNFVSNAIKYSPKGGKVIVHTKLLQPEEKNASQSVQVAIEDEGLGIPEDKLANLFDSFTRVDTKEHKMVDGTGLGLAICKEIVEAHQGKVYVESVHKEGTTFYFSLPV